MSSTVFILGAGASKESGAPLMADFLDVADHLWKLGNFKEYDADFRSVFEAIAALQPVHSKSDLDIRNIESIFATFEMSRTLGRFPGKTLEQINALIVSLKKLIVCTLEQTVQVTQEDGKHWPPRPYLAFVNTLNSLREKAKPKQSVSVLTFNYDMGLDYALRFIGTKYKYHLEQDQAGEGLPLLKLHGSLNWARCTKCDHIVPISLEKIRWQGPLNSDDGEKFPLTISSKLSQFRHCEQSLTDEPTIVPPTWHKEDYHRAIATVWSRAAQELCEAENIFVLGYSLPPSDAFFRYLYALGTVGTVTLKRFWVFNPDKSPDVRQRFEDLLGPGARARFSYFPLTFSEAIKTIGEEFGQRPEEGKFEIS
jgi:NAD-dependent SIR2 family protein deacetylase